MFLIFSPTARKSARRRVHPNDQGQTGGGGEPVRGGGGTRVRSFPTETASKGQCDRQTYILHAMADLYSKIWTRAPTPDPIFFISTQFSANFGQIMGWRTPPPPGDPGSATGTHSFLPRAIQKVLCNFAQYIREIKKSSGN